MKPQLYIDQKITAFVNKYSVFAADQAGNKAQLAAFAQQKRLAFKEKVLCYTDEQKTSPVFSFRAEKVLDVHGRYFIEDPAGQLLGMLRKEFGKSLVSSSWIVMDANGNDVFRVKESNTTLAILRRYIGVIPYLGDILEIIILFFRYHFIFIDMASNIEVGKYRKVTLFRDHYTLDMTDDAYRRLDWRVLAAMGIALDALKSR